MVEKMAKLIKIDLLIVLILIGLSLLVSTPFFSKGYFSMHDDAQVMRLFEMEKCLKDGQIPCRWVPDMGAGFGHPLYNFHPVLPYYLGMFFRLMGFSFIDTAKILFFLTVPLAGIFMFFLAKEFWGRIGGFVSAVFYIFVPYHALDIYVRGALAESWAISLFPLIFWALYRFVKEEKFLFFLLSVFALSSLFLSHNIMTLTFAPFAFFWVLFWIVVLKRWRQIVSVICAYVLAFTLSSFFLLPAFFEQKFVKIENLIKDYYDFRGHFVTLRQLFFDRKWGFGPSRIGPNDDMSFQIGWPYWWMMFFVAISSLFFFLKKYRREFFLSTFLVASFLFFAFMTHAKSIFIWDKISILAFVQFPWRFLALVTFSASLASGCVIFLLFKIKFPKIHILIVAAFLIGLTLFLNKDYFQPGKYFPKMTDQEKLSGKEWEIQSKATLLDYIPKQVKKIPEKLAPDSPWVLEGDAKISEFAKRSDFWRFTAEISSKETAKIAVPVFDFPKWIVLIDQKPVTYVVDDQMGIITVFVPNGKHTVVGWFQNTSLRILANVLTLVSFLILVLLTVFVSRRNEKNT